MSGSSGTNTVVQNSSPPQQYLDAYSNVLNQAEGVAAQPLQQYPGSIVAPLNSTQEQAFGDIENEQGTAQPYISQAEGSFGQATTPLWGTVPQLGTGQVTGAANTGISDINQAAGTNIGAAGTSGITAATAAAGTNIAAAGQPGINAAEAAANTNPSAVGSYLSPYIGDVVNSTQAEFNNENQQSLEQLQGQEVNQGAWGGDRTGVAAANLANQEQLAQAPAIANIENTGYQSAEQELETQEGLQANTGLSAASLGQSATTSQAQLGAQTGLSEANLGQTAAQEEAALEESSGSQNLGILTGQQGTQLGAEEANAWLNSQAGFGEASLGTEAQNTNLTDISSLLQSGGLEQSEEQENLDVPYEEFEAQQAYPFQTTNFLSGIAEGTGSAAGGTGTSTATSDPSILSGITGAAESGLGIAGLTGGFGSSGWLTSLLGGSGAAAATDAAAGIGGAAEGGDALAALGDLGSLAFAARGGAIHGRAKGGIAGDNDNEPPHYERRTGTHGGITGHYDGGGDIVNVPIPTARPNLPTDPTPDIPAGGIVGGTAPVSAYAPDYTPPAGPARSPSESSAELRGQAPWLGLLTAGLGTLATGNVGRGGLEGVKNFSDQMKQASDIDEKQQDAADTGQYRLADLKQRGQQLSDAADEAKARLKQDDEQFGVKSDEEIRHDKADESNAANAQALEAKRLNAEAWDAPVTIDVPDGKGGSTQVLAQQNKLNGQWATADQNRTPINASGIGIDKSSASSGGGRYQAQVGRILTDAKDATTDLGNLANLPLTASTGWFGGRGADTGKSLLTSTMDVLANKVTPQDVQDYNTTAVGLGRALSGLETGGMQVNQGLMSQFEKLQLADGDTQFTKMRKLATMRQQGTNALETFLTSPLAAPAQKAYAQQMISDMQKAIPWTPADVTALEHSKDPKATLLDTARKNRLGSSSAPAAPAAPAQPSPASGKVIDFSTLPP